jgi:hypothetical protein
MDAIDILGSLLGGRSGSGSPAGNVLRDMLGGKAPAPASQPKVHPNAQRPRTIDGAAKSLEELLGVGRSSSQPAPQMPPTRTQTAPTSSPSASSIFPDRTPALDEQAKLLLRAMLSASKSDGQVTEEEQQAIFKQLGTPTQEQINYLRDEFSKPLDVRQLAWDVPLGMEEQVYTVTLLSINLDEQKEAEYLAELAHGLRISPKRCNEIHHRYNSPAIFQD